MSKCGFEKLLLEAVDEALSSLGDSSKQVVYFHLEKTFKLNRQDIPHKIEEFADAIENIFGYGAKLIEILIMKRLYEKVKGVVEFEAEHENLIFSQYVAAVKQSFLKNKTRIDSTQKNESQSSHAPIINEETKKEPLPRKPKNVHTLFLPRILIQ